MTTHTDQTGASKPEASEASGTEGFADETIRVWQPYAQRTLTREDAREIAYNVIGFFRVLKEWAEEERRNNTP